MLRGERPAARLDPTRPSAPLPALRRRNLQRDSATPPAAGHVGAIGFLVGVQRPVLSGDTTPAVAQIPGDGMRRCYGNGVTAIAASNPPFRELRCSPARAAPRAARPHDPSRSDPGHERRAPPIQAKPLPPPAPVRTALIRMAPARPCRPTGSAHAPGASPRARVLPADCGNKPAPGPWSKFTTPRRHIIPPPLTPKNY